MNVVKFLTAKDGCVDCESRISDDSGMVLREGDNLNGYETVKDCSGLDNMEEHCGDDLTEPFDPTKIKISKKAVSIDHIIRKFNNGTLMVAPDFQRNEVWDETRKSRLIESMMLNIPIPMFYVAASDDGIWEVVDGLQRLTAIKEFLIDKKLRLTKLESWTAYNKNGIDELPPFLYNRIYETELSFIVIEPGTPDAVKYNIFKRINTGGMVLSAQEIRHALYQGKGTRLLCELVESVEFKNATDNSISDKRMAAREIILRSLVFSLIGYESYRTGDNFDSFLRRGIQAINYIDNPALIRRKVYEDKWQPRIRFDNIDGLKRNFLCGMERCYQLFENNAFRLSSRNEKRTSINRGLFETWSVLIAELSDDIFRQLLSKKEKLLRKYDDLKKDESFRSSVSQHASKQPSVIARFETVRRIILETVS